MSKTSAPKYWYTYPKINWCLTHKSSHWYVITSCIWHHHLEHEENVGRDNEKFLRKISYILLSQNDGWTRIEISNSNHHIDKNDAHIQSITAIRGCGQCNDESFWAHRGTNNHSGPLSLTHYPTSQTRFSGTKNWKGNSLLPTRHIDYRIAYKAIRKCIEDITSVDDRSLTPL